MMRQLLRTPLYLAMGVILVGCAKSDVNDLFTDSDSNAIKLNTSVSATRSTDTVNTTLQETTVTLYVNSLESEAPESIDYTYANGLWGATTDKSTWSDVGFPTSFFSANDGEAQTLSVTDEGTATLTYTVDATETADTKDLVYFGMDIESMPVGGNIYAYFKHALSKININISTGSDKVYIQSIRLVNFNDAATLTISDDDSIVWLNDDSSSASYNYITQTASENQISGDDLLVGDGTNAFLTIPQVTQASAAIAWSLSSDTYIEVIYYSVDSDGYPVVGYSNWEDLTSFGPSYSEYQDLPTPGYFDMNYCSEPLLVKAAFPLNYDSGFKAGNQYNITLGFDSSQNDSGGIIISDSYYGDDGQELFGISDIVTPTVGDTAITSTASQVGLYIDTVAWSAAATTVEPDGISFAFTNPLNTSFPEVTTENYQIYTSTLDFTIKNCEYTDLSIEYDVENGAIYTYVDESIVVFDDSGQPTYDIYMFYSDYDSVSLNDDDLYNEILYLDSNILAASDSQIFTGVVGALDNSVYVIDFGGIDIEIKESSIDFKAEIEIEDYYIWESGASYYVDCYYDTPFGYVPVIVRHKDSGSILWRGVIKIRAERVEFMAHTIYSFAPQGSVDSASSDPNGGSVELDVDEADEDLLP